MSVREKCQNIIEKPKQGRPGLYIGGGSVFTRCGNVAVGKDKHGYPHCKKCKEDPYRSLCK